MMTRTYQYEEAEAFLATVEAAVEPDLTFHGCGFY